MSKFYISLQVNLLAEVHDKQCASLVCLWAEFILRQNFAKTCCGSPLYLSPEIVNQEPQLWRHVASHFCHFRSHCLIQVYGFSHRSCFPDQVEVLSKAQHLHCTCRAH